MVEMRLIDLDTLTVYLGLELGIPIATLATLERAKRPAVRMLTPEHALLFRCIPLMLQDRQLIAAVDDPLDMATMDQLSRLTGYRILPRVAPELRIFFYLERYYGIARPSRYASIDVGDPRARPVPGALPAPPLPGLPPRSESPIRVPPVKVRAMPAPAPMTTPSPSPTGPSAPPAPAPPAADTTSSIPEPISPSKEITAEHQALEQEADQLASTLASDESDRADTAPPIEPDAEAMNRAVTLDLDDVSEVYEPCSLESALAIMKEAPRRGEVADALMSYSATLFDIACLCIVRDNMAFGWKAHGPDIDRQRVEALLIPLDHPSMFQIAIHNAGQFHAVPFPATLHSYLYRVLRCQPPSMAAVAVITISSRVVNILYGHRDTPGGLDDNEQDCLRRAAQAATDAYVRLIAASKKSG